MQKIKIERKADWVLRQATLDDRENLKLFYKNHLWQNKDVELLYRWKYEENPFGETLMWAGINSLNMVISNCIFIPWEFRLDNKRIGATQVVDAFTQLEYRGQGIVFKQMKEGIDAFKKKNSPICLAFPNENGAAVHRKNKGHHLGRIIRYTKPLKSKYLISRVVKSEVLLKILSFIGDAILRLCSKDIYCLNLHGFNIEKIDYCTAEFDNLWNRYIGKFNNRLETLKSSSYLNWKCVNSPNKNRALYSLKKGKDLYGFVVLESTPKIGYIVDILALDKAALNYLVAYSIKHFRKEDKDSVVYIALENNAYFRDFEKFGFVKRPEEKHFYIYLDENIENREFFLDSKNWFITIGDCDVEAL